MKKPVKVPFGRTILAFLPSDIIEDILAARGDHDFPIEKAASAADAPMFAYPEMETVVVDEDNDDVDDIILLDDTGDEEVVPVLIGDISSSDDLQWLGYCGLTQLRGKKTLWMDVRGVRPLTCPYRATQQELVRGNRLLNADSRFKIAVIDTPSFVRDEVDRLPFQPFSISVDDVAIAIDKLWPTWSDRDIALLRFISDPVEPLTLEIAKTLGFRSANSVHRAFTQMKDALADMMGGVPGHRNFFFHGSEYGYRLDETAKAAMIKLGLLEEVRSDTSLVNPTGSVTTVLENINSPGETISVTSTTTVVQARLGQGQFRESLERYWGGACAVTGCRIGQVLVASHIVPWADASDSERLDRFNGILLIANLDRLFDAFLITFEDTGHIRISPHIAQSEWRALGLSPTARLRMVDDRHRPYLARHRARFNAT